MPRSSNLVIGWALAATGATLAIAAVASVILLASPGPAAAGPPGSHAQPQQRHAVPASASATISLRATKLGKILVAPNGHTLYAFTRDGRNQDRCTMVSGCTGVWALMGPPATQSAGRGGDAAFVGPLKVRSARSPTPGTPCTPIPKTAGPGTPPTLACRSSAAPGRR